ncbi:Lrp/AsnC ligand binding domain-containing protein [Rhodococcus tibetensis]|uniref:Lrp/AsnC ligand binding domain-containing protein n=1 Tax=Rhodococcus tibetensis TaxID=2965064 RepID=A0ABT1QAM2_9NOCA|nr:Lrp/AsnC ligand binding domain-containing protein [Rhodococcus sp. FXJ9.536]MCQ4119281.1 Lrp/AsnC ligand binding domain-containing protein [Rhodococcus sp. FXJ9.536]
MQAFILIQTEVGKASAVAVQIAQITGVRSAEDVIGPYDVIVRVSADDVAPVVQEIRRVPGITRTLTCDIPEKPNTI